MANRMLRWHFLDISVVSRVTDYYSKGHRKVNITERRVRVFPRSGIKPVNIKSEAATIFMVQSLILFYEFKYW